MPWRNNGSRRQPAASVGPPGPEAVREQLAAEQAQRDQQWAKFIARRVLPMVSEVLRSKVYISHWRQPLGIHGSRTAVRVSAVNGSTAWVRPLLDALSHPAYSGYTVQFMGRYSAEGGDSVSIEPLDSRDIEASARQFRAVHPGGHFLVKISL